MRPVLVLALAASAACGRGDLASRDPERRAAAVRGLARDDRSLAQLVVAANDPNPGVRVAAAEAFAARGGAAAADALGALLVDPAPEVARAAARGLAGMPHEPRARAQLVQRYAGATPAGRAAVADALEIIGVSLREAVESEARALWERNLAAVGASQGEARCGAIEELGASGRAEAVQRLLPLVDPVRNRDRALVAAAARGLGESGDWTVRRHLEALLPEDAALGEAAADALGRLGDPAAADALAAAAIDQPRIGMAAVSALAALPDAQEIGVALCEVASRAADPTIAAGAAREARRRDAECPERPLLARLGGPGAAAALEALAELGLAAPARAAAAPRVAALLERSPAVPVRIAAARALVRLGGELAAGAVGRRAAALSSAIAERRARRTADPGPADEAREARAILAAAGALRAPGAEAILAAHASDPHPEIRAGAVEGLSHLGGTRAIDAVRAACGDPDPAVRASAIDGLGRLGRQGARLAAACRGAPHAGWGRSLARALAETAAAEAIPTLTELLDGPAAGEAAAALARIGAPEAAAPLATYLRSGDGPARAEAIEALAQLVSRESAPTIAPLLTDDRPDVRAAAALALGKLGHEAASQRLEALRSDYYGRVRRAAVEALAKLPSSGPRVRR